MQPYKPEQYAATFAKPIGGQLWAFVNRPEVLARMEAASEMGRAAVEGIAEPLVAEFGPPIRHERVKEMLAHMIRQAMEARGWITERAEAKVHSYPFSKGARFTRAGWFTFHIFRDEADPATVCLTGDRKGARLPTGDGRQWSYWTSLNSPARATVALNLKSFAAARAAVLSQGFCLHEIKRAKAAPGAAADAA